MANSNLTQKLAKVSQQLTQWLSGPSLASTVAATQGSNTAQQQPYNQFSAFAPPAPQPPPTPSDQSMIGQMIQQLQSGQQQSNVQDIITQGSAEIIGDLIAGSVEKALTGLTKLNLNIKAAKGDPMAIAQVALNQGKESKEKWEKLKTVGSNLAQPFQGQPMQGTPTGDAWRMSKWVGDVGKGFKELGGPLSGILGSTLKGVGKFGTVVTSTMAAIEQSSQRYMSEGLRYAQWSGSMAYVMAQKNVRDIRLSQMYGEGLAESTQRLAEATSRREFQEAPLWIRLGNAERDMSTFFENLRTGVGAGVANFAQNLMAGQNLGQAFTNAMNAAAAAVAAPPVAPDDIGIPAWFSLVGNAGFTSLYGSPADLANGQQPVVNP